MSFRASSMILGAALLMAGVSGVALAANAQQPAQGQQEAVSEDAALTADAQSIINATDAAARKTVIQNLLAANPSRAAALLAKVKQLNPTLAASVYADMVAVLGGNPANDTIVQALSDANPDLISDNTESSEENAPAGGNDKFSGANQDLGGTVNNNSQQTTNSQESGSQLQGTEGGGNDASPSKPKV